MKSSRKIFFVLFVAIIFVYAGNFFVAYASTITVTGTDSTVANNGLCSLPEAIVNANNDDQSGSTDCTAGSGADVISLSVDVVLNTVIGTHPGYPDAGVEHISEDLTIEGNSHSISRSLAGPDIAFFVHDPALVTTINTTLQNLTISNFNLGAVNSVDFEADVVIDNVIFSNISDASLSGLGVISFSGQGLLSTLTVSDSEFNDNEVSGIFFANDTEPRHLTVTDTIFDSNSADQGSAMNLDMQSTSASTFSNLEITGNSATGDGGGIFFENGGVVTVFENINFENNSAGDDGGAIFTEDSGLGASATGITFTGNSATGDGGGIYAVGGDVIVEGFEFLNNSAVRGGSIYIATNSSDTVEIKASSFNRTSGSNGANGGAIFLDGETIYANFSADVSGNLFTNLSVTGNGGAIAVEDGIALSIYNNNFYNNIANNGGAFAGLGDENGLEMLYNTFLNNSVSAGAGRDLFYDPVGLPDGPLVYYNLFSSTTLVADPCGGDLSGFTFDGNLSDVADADCGVTTGLTGVATAPADNGGPLDTIALIVGSSAIDVGFASCPTLDSRGLTRSFGAECDAGAFEYTVGNVVITESGGTTVASENGTTDTYEVVLDYPPTNDVLVTLGNDVSKSTVSPLTLTFTSGNWSMPQVVTVSAVHNTNITSDQTDTISHTVSSVDFIFDGVTVSSVTTTLTNIDSGGGGGGGGGGSDEGCTDPLANNFDSSADDDDGSCEYDPTTGCMDTVALNFEPLATISGGVCIYPAIYYGCTDNSANNFDDDAVINDGSCEYDDPVGVTDISGCMDADATNYNPSATLADGSCSYIDIPIDTDPPGGPGPSNPSNPGSGGGSNGGSFNPPKEILKVIVPVGLAVPLLVTLIQNSGLVASALSIPIRIWTIIPTLMGYKRRKRPWGTVYDSVTKQPLDPVYVTLFGADKKEVTTSITDIDGRYGFFVPAGTPVPVIARLNAAIKKAAQNPEFVKKVQQEGLVISASDPAEFDRYVKAEEARWRKIVKENNIKAD